MPKLPQYVQNTEARSTPFLVRSDHTPDMHGAQVGRALQNLAGSLSSIGGALGAKQQQQNRSQAAIALAQLTGEASIAFAQAQVDAPPGGAGLGDTMVSFMDERGQAILDQFGGDPDTRRYIEERLAVIGSDVTSRAGVAEIGLRADHATQQTKIALEGLYSSVQRDPTTALVSMESGFDLIENSTASPAVKAQLRTAFQANIANTYFESAIDGLSTLEQAELLQNQLASSDDAIAQHLTEDKIDTFRGALSTRINAIQTGIQADVHARSEAMIERLKTDTETVDSAQLSELGSEIVKYGDTAHRLDFLEAVKQYDQRRGMKGKTLEELEGIQADPGGAVQRGALKITFKHSEIDQTHKEWTALSPHMRAVLAMGYSMAGRDSIDITSGYRPHSKGSFHGQRTAADVSVRGMSHAEIIELAKGFSAAGATEIGIEIGAAGGDHIHVAVGGDKYQVFGPDGTSATTPEWAKAFEKAHESQSFRGAVAAAGPGGVSFGGAAAVLRQEEGFRTTAYWDTNAWRVGYGSDTYMENGVVKKVQKGTVITRDMAEADLRRRVGEFAGRAAGQVGDDRWNSLPGAVKSALTSVAYNYGSLPKSVVNAVKTGNIDQIAASVESLSANPKRRAREAAIIRGEAGIDGDSAYHREMAAGAAIDAYNKGMKEDPTKFVLSYVDQFFPEDQGIDPSTGEGLGARAQGIFAARDYLGEPDIPLLTERELDSVNAAIDDMDVNERKEYARSIYGELGREADEFFDLLADDQPMLSFAGFLMTATGQERMAMEIIAADRRYDLLGEGNGSKYVNDIFKESFDFTGPRMPADIAHVFRNVPEALVELQQAADLLYASRFSGPGGHTEFKEAAYREIVSEILGGQTVESVNGKPVLLPPGIDASTMETALDQLTDDHLYELSVSGGQPVYLGFDGSAMPVKAEDMAREGELVAVGSNGEYSIRFSDGGLAYDALQIAEGVTDNRAQYVIRLDSETVQELATQRAKEVDRFGQREFDTDRAVTEAIEEPGTPVVSEEQRRYRTSLDLKTVFPELHDNTIEMFVTHIELQRQNNPGITLRQALEMPPYSGFLETQGYTVGDLDKLGTGEGR